LKRLSGLLAKTVALCLVVLLVAFLTFQGSFLAMADDAALSAVEDADSAVRQAFGVVSETERAGGNVSSLLARLNQAAVLLAESQMAYRNGNSSEATGKAGSAGLIAEGVRADALSLKNSVLADAQQALWIAFAFSLVGGAAFAVGLVLVWRRFRRAYVKRLMEMKPEVVQ